MYVHKSGMEREGALRLEGIVHSDTLLIYSCTLPSTVHYLIHLECLQVSLKDSHGVTEHEPVHRVQISVAACVYVAVAILTFASACLQSTYSSEWFKIGAHSNTRTLNRRCCMEQHSPLVAIMSYHKHIFVHASYSMHTNARKKDMKPILHMFGLFNISLT